METSLYDVCITHISAGHKGTSQCKVSIASVLLIIIPFNITILYIHSTTAIRCQTKFQQILMYPREISL